MSYAAIKGGGDFLELLDGRKADGSESSLDSFDHLTPSSIKRQLRKDYGRRAVDLVSRYFRTTVDLSAYASKVKFLKRCSFMGVVPADYRVECPGIENMRHVLDVLDICSDMVMLADLDYCRMRKQKLLRQLEQLRGKLASVLSSEDLRNVLALSKAKYDNVFEATREEQRAMLAELLEEYEMNSTEEEDDQ